MISLLVRDWRRVILLCAFPVAVLGAAEAMAADSNDRGNIVIADQFNNRVIEIDRARTPSCGSSETARTNPAPTASSGPTTPSDSDALR